MQVTTVSSPGKAQQELKAYLLFPKEGEALGLQQFQPTLISHFLLPPQSTLPLQVLPDS